ncbi:MAG TPA: hypothetical protein VEJ63_17220 [Planctomycetota bacterium]|nr:hypothetical protein [Planctomycetota bacterium]
MRWAIFSAFLFICAIASAADEAADPPVALRGHCPVCLIDADHVSPGKQEFSSTYKGYKYLFPRKRTKDKFDANPDRYAIQLDGYSPVSRADGKDEKGDPAIYAVYNKKIYIFTNEQQREEFVKDAADILDLREADKTARPDRG